MHTSRFQEDVGGPWSLILHFTGNRGGEQAGRLLFSHYHRLAAPWSLALGSPLSSCPAETWNYVKWLHVTGTLILQILV